MTTLSFRDHIDPADNITVMRDYCRKQRAEAETHSHEFVEIVYCFEGVGVQMVGGHAYPMTRGTLLFLNYGQAHSFYSENGMHFFNFLLLPSFISESLINTVDALSLLSLAAFSDFTLTDAAPVIRVQGRDMLEVEDIAERMEREFIRKEPGYRAVLLGYMTVLFSKIFRRMSLPAETDATPAKHSIAPEIIAYIEAHLSERITLGELACRSFYNPSYFSRVFKAYTGQNLSDFINRKRVERALALLQTTDLSAEQIGAAVGFGEKKQFYRQFKHYTGVTPGAARRGVPMP